MSVHNASIYKVSFKSRVGSHQGALARILYTAFGTRNDINYINRITCNVMMDGESKRIGIRFYKRTRYCVIFAYLAPRTATRMSTIGRI